MNRKHVGSKLKKLNPRWEFGIFVGVRRKSNEVWGVNKSGAHLVRSIKRVPEEKRYSKDNLEWVQWVPWHRYKGAEDADGEIPEGVPVEERLTSGGQVDGGVPKVIIKTREKAPRDFGITIEDARKYGYTKGCEGCNSWFRGLSRQPHTEECRKKV